MLGIDAESTQVIQVEIGGGCCLQLYMIEDEPTCERARERERRAHRQRIDESLHDRQVLSRLSHYTRSSVRGLLWCWFVDLAVEQSSIADIHRRALYVQCLIRYRIRRT